VTKPPESALPHDSFYIQVECHECGWDWDGWNTDEAERAMREHTIATGPLKVEE